jgi:NAD(P)-dependent dehydrogenase (short-subunit alcohol dehydrogenase family)
MFSKFGSKGDSIYAASKGALDSLVRSLAVELAPDIRVNSILPGGLRTKMTRHLFENSKYMAEFNEKYLLGEGNVADVAALVKFIVSSEAKWITGQNLIVDGGCSCHL